MREWGARVGVYVLGLLLLALGSTLTINVNLGMSAVNCFPYVIGKTLDVSYGNGLVVVFVFFIGLQYLMLGRQFHISNLLQFPVTFLFGYFADFWVWTFGGYEPETYFTKILVLLMSIGFVAFGVALYVTPNIMPNPVEGLSLAASRRFGKPFPIAKTLTDSTAVAVTVVIGIVFLGSVVGVGEGTIISALLTGKAVGVFFKITRPLAVKLAGIDSFLHKAEKS